MEGLQFLSNEQGEVTGVVVPIDRWREIESELETQYLLRSETMRKRLTEAMARTEGIPFDEALRRLGVDRSEFE